MQEEHNHNHSKGTRDRRTDEAPLPAGNGYEDAHKKERKPLSKIMAEAEEAVECASFAERIPP